MNHEITTRCPECKGTGITKGFDGQRHNCGRCWGSGESRQPKERCNGTLILENIKVGDRIVFKSPTREGCRKATRVVTSIPGQMPWPSHFTVKSFNGWSDFAVKHGEIVAHHPAS